MRQPLATVLLAALAITRCSGTANDVNPLLSESQQPVTLTRLADSPQPLTNQSGITDPTRLVIRDAAVWADMWRQIWTGQPAPSLPVVDFGREMVIVAALGTRSSGGHAIVIESGYQQGGSLHVVVRTETPGGNCMATMALTAPVDVARVPEAGGAVQFDERAVIRDC